MPKTTAPPPPGLDEVERAISLLEGRHPEHERTKRETMAAAEERRGEIERELARGRRKRLRRMAVIAANFVAVGIAGFVASRFFSRTSAIRESLAREEAAFVARGYVEIASNEITARKTLEANAPASSCFVALATRGPLHVHAGSIDATAERSIGWCDCGPSTVTLETRASSSTTGLALLRIDSREVGGPLARSWLSPSPEAWADTTSECSEAMLDAWIGDGRVPRTPPGAGSLDTFAGGKALRESGFELAAFLADAHPFTVVDSRAGDCALAISPGGGISLRTTGGARVVEDARGALAWCASAAMTVTLWRAGASSAPLVVAEARADRVGGMLGALECAREAGLSIAPGATWLRADDAAWDASALLRASKLDSTAGEDVPAEPGARDGRVTSLVFTPATGLAWDPADVAVACNPPLADASGLAESICAPAAPVSWWRRGDAPAHAARAALPFWVGPLLNRHEPDAVARIPELLALARSLARRGFEPTVLEGVTELPDGVRVVGRAGEDAVVAVGLAPRAPWVFPYSDGDAWELGNAPHVVELQPGAAVKLGSSPPAPIDLLEKRRTVVFRRVSHP